jgi:hypothetical protein
MSRINDAAARARTSTRRSITAWLRDGRTTSGSGYGRSTRKTDMDDLKAAILGVIVTILVFSSIARAC